MVQGAKHMKSNNAAANGGSSPQPKPQPKPKRRRKRLPRWADRLITIVIILIGVGLMTWPWILDRLEASEIGRAHVNSSHNVISRMPSSA